MDDSVCKSWELDASQFSINNPAWKLEIQLILQEVVKGLGILAPPMVIQAELYKLLLYKEGAFFLLHHACLPSKHMGGDVIALHKGESLTFKTEPTSEFGYSYAAWYADVMK